MKARKYSERRTPRQASGRRTQVFDLSPKKRPTQGRAKLTYAALLEATIQILAEEGYAAVTTNRVAERAGVSVGSLYEYFPHKQALVAVALGREIETLTEGILQSLHRALSLPGQPRTGIEHWLRSMMALLESRADLLRVAQREVPFLWQIPEMRRLSHTLLRIAQEGQVKSRRVIRLQDPEASTWLLITMVWGALVQTVLQRPRQLDEQRVMTTLVEMVLKLLGH